MLKPETQWIVYYPGGPGFIFGTNAESPEMAAHFLKSSPAELEARGFSIIEVRLVPLVEEGPTLKVAPPAVS